MKTKIVLPAIVLSILPAIVLSIIVILSGCLTFDVGSPNPDKRIVSGTALKAIKDALITTTTAAFQLCDQGVLSEGDCVVVDQTYMEGRQLIIEAKEAWDVLVAEDSFDTRNSYNKLIWSIVQITTDIEIIIRGGS